MKIVYKIVEKRNGRYYSPCTKLPPLRLEYEIGKVTKPFIGKIHCFEDLESALSFIFNGNHILKCETDNYEIVEKMLIPSLIGNVDEVKNFWENNVEERKKIDVVKGTVLCDWVKPIEVRALYFKKNPLYLTFNDILEELCWGK